MELKYRSVTARAANIREYLSADYVSYDLHALCEQGYWVPVAMSRTYSLKDGPKADMMKIIDSMEDNVPVKE